MIPKVTAANPDQIEVSTTAPALDIPRELSITLKKSTSGNAETKAVDIPEPNLPLAPDNKKIIAEALHCLKNRDPLPPLPAEQDGEGCKITFMFDSPSSDGARFTLTAHLDRNNSMRRCSVQTPQTRVSASFGAPETGTFPLVSSRSGLGSFTRLVGTSSGDSKIKRSRPLSLQGISDDRMPKLFKAGVFRNRPPVDDAQEHLDIARQTLDSNVKLLERAVPQLAAQLYEGSVYESQEQLPWQCCADLYGPQNAPLKEHTPPDETVVFSAGRLAAMFGVHPNELPHVAIMANNDAEELEYDVVRFSQTDAGLHVQKLGAVEMDEDMANLGTLNNALTNYQRSEYFFRKLDIPINDLAGYRLEQNELTGNLELAHHEVVDPDNREVPAEAKELQHNPYTNREEILDMRTRQLKSDKHVFEDHDVARKLHDKLTDIARAL